MSNGNQAVYRTISFRSRIAFDVAMGACGVAALAAYENVSHHFPFYMVAVLAVVTCSCYTLYFYMYMRESLTPPASKAQAWAACTAVVVAVT